MSIAFYGLAAVFLLAVFGLVWWLCEVSAKADHKRYMLEELAREDEDRVLLSQPDDLYIWAFLETGK